MAPYRHFFHEEGCHRHIGLAVTIPIALCRCKINLAEPDGIAIGERYECYAVVRIDEISPDFPVCPAGVQHVDVAPRAVCFVYVLLQLLPAHGFNGHLNHSSSTGIEVKGTKPLLFLVAAVA